jgi:DNA-directed RNA polymerase sigma subunit (sigma70/sigma32)
MYLLGKKIRARFIKHPLGEIENLPLKLEEQEIDSLVDRLKKKDNSAIERIVIGHLRLAIYIAGQYANFAPKKAYDFISEAVVGIVEICNEIINTGIIEDELSKLIIIRMHKLIVKFFRKDHLIRIPYTSLIRNKIKISVSSLDENISKKQYNLLDFFDILNTSMKTDQERKIVELRILKYNDIEIGKKLKLHPTTIGQIRKRIFRRFKKNEKH